MLRHKSGCENRVQAAGDRCLDANDDLPGHLWTDHPVISWDIAIAFSFVEMYVLSPALCPGHS